MCKDNKAQKVDFDVFDIDYNSLYPSAMSTLSYPVGAPKLLRPEMIGNGDPKLSHQMHSYFARVKILRVPVSLHFPLLSIKD